MFVASNGDTFPNLLVKRLIHKFHMCIFLATWLQNLLFIMWEKINISIPVSIHGGSRNLSAIPNCQPKIKMLSTNWFQLAGSLHSFHHAYVYMHIFSNIYLYMYIFHMNIHFKIYTVCFILYIHLNDPE